MLFIISYFPLLSEDKNKNLSVSTSSTTEKTNHENHAHQMQYNLLFNKGLLRPKKEVYKYNEPADLIELVPILRDINQFIPRQFSLAEHKFILDPSRVTIHHEWMDQKTRRAEKNSIISMSYTNSNSSYGSHLDVLLFYSSQLGFSDWSSYPLGNYTVTFDRNNPSGERKFYIRAVTRF